MNEIPENTGNSGPPDLETLDYLRGVKSSTCLLLPTTPSPTPLDFKHPLAEEAAEAPFLTLNDEPIIGDLQNPDRSGDTSSSGDSNSVVQDPVSAQLINNISMLDYQTLSKNGDLIMGEVQDCKVNGNLNFGNRKLPSFVTWNWPIIRKVLLWVVVSGLVACIGAIIAMVVTIPKTCNPDLPWYQGKVFYEIFPASFQDSNNDGFGDFKGLTKKLDYIHALGASAIRLNSIFEAHSYPEHYHNVSSLMRIDRSLGTIKDFQNLVAALHEKNMSIILDIPVQSLAVPITATDATHGFLLSNHTLENNLDPTSKAISHWAKAQHVDGFYLKRLENFVNDAYFGKTLQLWKKIIGSGKILIVSEKAYKSAKGDALTVLLSKIDLIDIHIDLQNGSIGLKNRIEEVIGGDLWAKPHYPWVHWNVGNVDSERISTRHINNTLALTALEFILPGTISIFYGDEIGLKGLPKNDSEKDHTEHELVHNLVPMVFATSDKNENNIIIHPWNWNSALEPKYQFLAVLRRFAEVRLNTPTIYLRGIYKEGNLLKNAAVRKTEDNLVVIERWYPRRNTCVFVGNLGNNPVTTDLSTMFYGGTVIAGTNITLIGQVIYLDKMKFFQ
ncbi:alpha amylase, catalytic domain-containing protein [Phthorimaea operculella]|nr:alpha amylase, catalytic domain-containing protein [Phthorimaea operculella]